MSDNMSLKDYYYDLPKELIAQDPLKNRSSSRLMVVNKETGDIEHKIFKDIIDYLKPGDCLVRNNTKVIPARLYGHKEGTDALIEILLLTRKDNDNWECLVKPGKKCRVGAKILFGINNDNSSDCSQSSSTFSKKSNGECGLHNVASYLQSNNKNALLIGEIVDMLEDGNRIIHFEYDGIFEEILDELGQMPLPPYITHKLEDKARYQTVYAKHDGSAAAPTAGLHFTNELLEEIEKKGVIIANVTLHVGLGTFRPVKVENVLEHHMHSEYYNIEEAEAKKINDAKKNGGRIISIGTTSTRTLESVADENGYIKPCNGWTDIFIYPGYKFKAVDALITNFHLPESTLLMLVSAFSDREMMLNCYKTAVEEKYRFFSFGDAMFIFNDK